MDFTSILSESTYKNQTEQGLQQDSRCYILDMYLSLDIKRRTMEKSTVLCFLSVTKMGIKKPEGVRCKCTHGKEQQGKKQREAEVWHRGGVSKNKKKMNAEGLPSSTGEN